MDIRELQAQLDESMAEFERLRAGAGEMMAKLKRIEVRKESSDGYVTVTVGPRGQLISLELDPRIYRHPDSVTLAETITETIHAASAEAIEAAAEVTRPFVPDEQIKAHMDGDFDAIFSRLDHQTHRMLED